MKEIRDQWEADDRNKLLDFEVETDDADWEAIASRLPANNQIGLRKAFRHWIGAAAAIAAVLLGGIAFYDHTSVTDLQVNESARMEGNRSNAVRSNAGTPAVVAATPVVPSHPATSRRSIHASAPIARASVHPATPTEEIVTETFAEEEEEVANEAVLAERNADERATDAPTTPQTKAAASATVDGDGEAAQRTALQPKKKTRSKGWSFGMGTGSLSLGTDQIVPQYVTNSASLRNDRLLSMNDLGAQVMNLPKTDIHHKTPIGLGLSVSKQLSERFFLLTGLNYSYLRSSWSTNGTYHTETDQRLHFIGLPLSVAYRIAQWDRLSLYATAGGMAEVNVAGKQHIELFSDDISIMKQTEHVRMKEWLWSVNGKIGLSYPVVRFVSAFAEVGASYYFDNGSAIETIHSEKPFNVSFNVGLRFGF